MIERDMVSKYLKNKGYFISEKDKKRYFIEVKTVTREPDGRRTYHGSWI